jgi:hypothetical protein
MTIPDVELILEEVAAPTTSPATPVPANNA